MHHVDLRARILTAIGAGGLAVLTAGACGGGSSTPTGGGDAATDAKGGGGDGATEASSDGSGGQDVTSEAASESGSGGDAAGDDSPSDAAPDVPSVRRPLLVGAALRSASPVPRNDWADCGEDAPPVNLDARTAAALARASAVDGCEEHASVAAFARLSLQLLAVGAPPGLVARAHAAARDEIRHARVCFALARRYGGAALGPGPLALDDLFDATAAASSPTAALVNLAALCAEEGCVGETLGVMLGAEALEHARDPFVRAHLARMVEEERAHVDLSWRVVCWAIETGGEPVRAAAARSIERGIAATLASPVRPLPEGVDPEAWAVHGRVTCAQARAVALKGIREVVEPCARALLGDTSAIHVANDTA